ncbi:MAG TPA: methyltransferase domain-containing protein [Gemmatimonadaceae bacterium]|nr:methyltransferase domain-containing protein [Gemmatimonadaceae bacterium]
MIDPFLLEIVACPWEGNRLQLDEGMLACSAGHRFPIVDGIPVLLRDDVEQTHFQATRSLTIARGAAPPGEFENRQAGELAPGEIDPIVQAEVAGTNGIMYKPLIGKLRSYPIPDLALPPGDGKRFLEIGSNWGRWCIAAARLGYTVVGVDPSLRGVRAASRVAAQLGVTARFVVGDARYLPIRDETFDVVYSYSVLQHLSKEDASAGLRHAHRILRPGGMTMIQMPNAFGLRSLYHQARRGFRPAREFEVRYWTPAELRRRFEELIGPARLTIDGFFSLNPQVAERHLLPLRYRAVVTVSDTLKRWGERFPIFQQVADSLTVFARKRGPADDEAPVPPPRAAA